MNQDPKIRHDQMVSNAVGCALMLALIPMWWWDFHWPLWLVEIINPVLIAAASYAIARWKRSLFAWVMFWAQIGIQVAGFIAGLFTRISYGTAELGGLAILATVVWLVRVPRLQPPALPDVTHIVHHHVMHGPDGQAIDLGQYGTGLPGSEPGELGQAGRPDVGRRLPLAIENPVRPRDLAARLREHVNRRN